MSATEPTDLVRRLRGRDWLDNAAADRIEALEANRAAEAPRQPVANPSTKEGGIFEAVFLAAVFIAGVAFLVWWCGWGSR